ncbi:hypothetical protein Tco_0536290 [Tanacetum coccineum]
MVRLVMGWRSLVAEEFHRGYPRWTLGENATMAIPNMRFNLVNIEGVWIEFLPSQKGFITSYWLLLGWLDMGLLGGVIGKDDCDDDG